jgi:hypothetical protein
MSDEVPTATNADIGYAVARAGLGSLPIVGAAATELFGLLLAPPLERRREGFLRGILERLEQLERSGKIEFAALPNDQAFVSAITQAASAAQRTSQKAKLDALQNAVVNAACKSAPPEALQEIFIRFVSDFSDWHLRILAFLRRPMIVFETKYANAPTFADADNLSGMIKRAIPELENQPQLLYAVENDLRAEGLLQCDRWSNDLDGHTRRLLATVLNPEVSMMRPGGAFLKSTTSFGDEFLDFITERSFNGQEDV